MWLELEPLRPQTAPCGDVRATENMGKSSKISRSGMQGFVKQKKLQKQAGGIHKQPTKPVELPSKALPTKVASAKPASKPKGN